MLNYAFMKMEAFFPIIHHPVAPVSLQTHSLKAHMSSFFTNRILLEQLILLWLNCVTRMGWSFFPLMCLYHACSSEPPIHCLAIDYPRYWKCTHMDSSVSSCNEAHIYDCLISVDWRHCRLPPRQLVTLTPELCQGTVDQHLTMVILGLTNRSLINQP